MVLKVDKKNKHVPRWIAKRDKDIGLDQWNTLPTVADRCWQSLSEFLERDGVDLSAYHFIEPSAGKGAFFSLLPPDRRTGIDIENFNDAYVHQDFLTWRPATKTPCIALGNPPFGHRGWLALAFVNHAAEFCDYVAFILPMSFESDGKGSPKTRVVGMSLMHSEVLSGDLFAQPDGKTIRVNTVWQIWRRNPDMWGAVGVLEPLPALDVRAANAYVDLFNVCTYPSRVCGMKRIAECDAFLQATYFTNHPPTLVDTFAEVRYNSGIGIVCKRDKDRVLAALKSVNWDSYSNLATNNCRHIAMAHVRQALSNSLDLYGN